MLVGSARPDSSPGPPEGLSYGDLGVGVRDEIAVEIATDGGLMQMRRNEVRGG
jgi:hypothetical protein